MTVPRALLDALAAPAPAAALRALDAAGELTAMIPELEAGRGFVQPEKHQFTVLEHNLAAVEALETALGPGAAGDELRDVLSWFNVGEALERTIGELPLRHLLRLAALVHDVAKPATAAMVEGALRFPRHGPAGAEMMQVRLPALGFGEEETRFVAAMVRYHLRPGELVRQWPPSDRAVRRFTLDLDGHVLPLMLVNLADGWATAGPRYTREGFRRHCGFVNYVVARAWSVIDADAAAEHDKPLISGEDVMRELDLEGGRLLGAVLTSVRRAQSEGKITTRDEALQLAAELLTSLRARGAE